VVMARGGGYGPGTPNEARDFQSGYLRAYFARQGVPMANLTLIAAEMTLAGFVDHLAPHRRLAAESLASARAQLDALAGAGTATPESCANTAHGDRVRTMR